jgi:predicted AAA+ superfamily ATPase
MIYAFEERIGDPSLFCGRKNEMTLLMNWINKIPRKLSKSKALLGRRKSGKTAIMQRLFNILWNQNGRIVPFYFEVRDQNRWLLGMLEN